MLGLKSFCLLLVLGPSQPGDTARGSRVRCAGVRLQLGVTWRIWIVGLLRAFNIS